MIRRVFSLIEYFVVEKAFTIKEFLTDNKMIIEFSLTECIMMVGVLWTREIRIAVCKSTFRSKIIPERIKR